MVELIAPEDPTVAAHELVASHTTLGQMLLAAQEDGEVAFIFLDDGPWMRDRLEVFTSEPFKSELIQNITSLQAHSISRGLGVDTDLWVAFGEIFGSMVSESCKLFFLFVSSFVWTHSNVPVG